MKRVHFHALLVIAALVAGFAGSALERSMFATRMQETTPSQLQSLHVTLADEDSQIIQAIERVSPAVVSIVVTKDLQVMRSNPLFFDDPFFFFDPFRMRQEGVPETRRQQIGGGTGFIFTRDGLILTNKHVVADEKAEYTVILHTGEEYPAQVQDRDPLNDVAVVKMLPRDGGKLPESLPTVSFGDSRQLKVGQRVIAVGNALSEFSNTVTVGVISAKGRSIIASDGLGRGSSLSNLIQTDAAINPGNSGGPLLNLAGEVIGINTAIAAGANGLGFALPIQDVMPVIESVKLTGKISRPVLGVRFLMLDESSAKEFNTGIITEGALLIGNSLNKEFAVLPGKPADRAGLREGDIITEINGEQVMRKTPLQEIISRHKPGDTLHITYSRQGIIMNTRVTLEEFSS